MFAAVVLGFQVTTPAGYKIPESMQIAQLVGSERHGKQTHDAMCETSGTYVWVHTVSPPTCLQKKPIDVDEHNFVHHDVR